MMQHQQAQNQIRQLAPAPAPQARPGFLQRACACGQHTSGEGECADCRQKHEATLQRAATRAGTLGNVPPIVHEVLRAPGQPLDAATRAFMEPRFGHDFSGVRIHTDSRAVASASAVNALAYTVGRNVVFGSGQYAPRTDMGRQLLAHELTHTVQQEECQALPSHYSFDTNDYLEQTAKQTATRVVAGEAAWPISSATGVALQRQADEIATSKNPNSLSDRDLIAEYQRVLAASDPATEAYFLALDAEVRQRFPLVQDHGTPVRPATLQIVPSPNPSAPFMAFVGPLPGVAAADVAAGTAATGATAGTTAGAAGEVAVGAGAAEGLGLSTVGFFALIFLLPFLLESDSPRPRPRQENTTRPQPQTQAQPQAQAQPQTQTQPRTQDRRNDCKRMHPFAVDCEEGISRDEVVVQFLLEEGYSYNDLLNCQGMSSFGANTIDGCDGAPGESWHCNVRGSSVPVSVFACLCCHADGSTGFDWRRPHWSTNLSRRQPRR